MEFSILLSGLIVKLGVWGLFRLLPYCDARTVFLLSLVCMAAMVEAAIRLWAQRDLKRIVALTTVLEMNWLVLCLSLGTPSLVALGALLAVAHSFTTTAEFFLVECISRRFASRDCTELQGLFLATPLLGCCALLTTLITVGFPGTSLFFIKFLFLATLHTQSFALWCVCLFLFLVIIPLFFIRL